MDDIVTPVRELAVAWGSHYDDEIWNKVKLASDVQNLTHGLMVKFLDWMKDNGINMRPPDDMSFMFASNSHGEGFTKENLIRDFLKTIK